jgi:hypothetical protein
MKYQVLLCMLFLVGVNSYGMDVNVNLKFMQRTARAITRSQNRAVQTNSYDQPLMTAEELEAAEDAAHTLKMVAQEKAMPVAALLKQLAGRKIKEKCGEYILRRVDEKSDSVVEKPLVSQAELAEISQDPVRYVLFAQLMLADESEWIAEDQQRNEFIAPFIAPDEDLEDRQSISDELSSNTTKSFESADDVEVALPSDEVGSDDTNSQTGITGLGNNNSQEEGAILRRSPRPLAKKNPRKKLKKEELEREVAAYEKKLGYFAREQVTLTQDEWSGLLKKAQSVGLYDCLISWVCEHRELVTLSYFREFFDVLISEEWATEDDFQNAGIKPIKRWLEPDSFLRKAVSEAIRVYALGEQEQLEKELCQQLKLGRDKTYEKLITRLSNAMYKELTGKQDKVGKKISMKKALERLKEQLSAEIKDERPVIGNFVREVTKTLDIKEWAFESTWNHVKSFFYLLLDLTQAYSQKLAEEVNFLIPDAADGDLVEIMRLTMERRFKRQPQYETELCKLLREAVELQGDQPLKDLTAELGNLIFEADPMNNSDSECALEEGPALDCLRDILALQDGDIADEQLLAA